MCGDEQVDILEKFSQGVVLADLKHIAPTADGEHVQAVLLALSLHSAAIGCSVCQMSH